jgi:hypothetical protein
MVGFVTARFLIDPRMPVKTFIAMLVGVPEAGWNKEG